MQRQEVTFQLLATASGTCNEYIDLLNLPCIGNGFSFDPPQQHRVCAEQPIGLSYDFRVGRVRVASDDQRPRRSGIEDFNQAVRGVP